jgi:hypothetical protein
LADGLIANGLLDDASIPIGNLNDCADVVLQSLRRFNSTLLPGVDGSDLLWERAAELNIAPHASFSANNACRLLPTLDGHLALNMARTEDWSLLPAWLQQPVADWTEVTAAVAQRSAVELLDRGRLMGLALSAPEQPRQFSWRDDICPASKTSGVPPRVVDLSALWAGPLCSHILARCGFEVIKVESKQRPDGARQGSPVLFAALHEDKECRRYDFSDVKDLARLHDLLVSADIVIEGSRPRALHSLGLDYERISARSISDGRPAKLWLSLTAYGRELPFGHWVGFGDDVAIAAGIVDRSNSAAPEFIGDAIADPLSGLLSSLVVLDLQQKQQSGLVDFSLFRAARYCVEWLQNHGGQLATTLKRPNLRC